MMEDIDTKKYNESDTEDTGGFRNIEVSLTYIGNNASANRAFYDELTKSPLFKVRKGQDVRVPDGGTQPFEWSYTPELSTKFVDHFAGMKEIADLRIENGWTVEESEPVKKPYTMDKQILKILVNKAYLYNLEKAEEK
jgi:hypothetical protein